MAMGLIRLAQLEGFMTDRGRRLQTVATISCFSASSRAGGGCSGLILRYLPMTTETIRFVGFYYKVLCNINILRSLPR